MPKKYAIYSACIGTYDNICQPLCVDDRFDFFLFTDEVNERKVGVWQVRKVDYTNPDMTRIARYVKTHPDELLPEYEATLWMDMSIHIAHPYIYERFLQLVEQRAPIASIQHPDRDCIYVEAYTMSDWLYEHDYIAFNWCHQIREEGYPEHIGLYETGIMFRYKCDEIKRFNQMWWECIDAYSKRDQFSCDYVLWKLSIPKEYFLAPGKHCLNTEFIEFNFHRSESRRKYVSMDWKEKLRLKGRRTSPKFSQWMWNRLCLLPNPNQVLKIWGYGMCVVYAPYWLILMFKHRVLHIPG